MTGASSGIGRAIALAAAHAGAAVALTYRVNAEGAGETAQAIEHLGGRVIVQRWDARDASDLPALTSLVLERFGRIDAWINNAGADILTGAGAGLSRAERLDLLLAVDLKGTMAASWHAADVLGGQPGGGVIVNMSWDHALTGMAGSNPELFAATKGGVLAFSKALARSVAPRVRVNIIAPGWIETAFGSELDAARREAIASTIPLRRWGTPEDVAAAVVFLASPAAAYLTGQTIFVGGGAVM